MFKDSLGSRIGGVQGLPIRFTGYGARGQVSGIHWFPRFTGYGAGYWIQGYWSCWSKGEPNGPQGYRLYWFPRFCIYWFQGY